MTIKVSTGLRNAMLVTGSLKSALDSGFIHIYDGTPPASADDAIAGTLLCTISVDDTGTGITMESTASGGTVEKAAAETWQGTNGGTGTAAYYRHVAPGDDGTSSTTQARIQGLIGTSGSDMNLSSVSLTSGAMQNIDFYSISLPTG